MRIPPAKDILMAVVFALLVVAFGATAFWTWRKFMTSAPYVDTERYPVRGIDVSSHNGYVNFKRVAKDGYEFVFIKATEGVDFKDKNFLVNYYASEKAGLKRGAYHFFRFDRDGVDQAVNFLRTVKDHPLELGLAIDVEAEGNPKGVPVELVQERLQAMLDFLNMEGYRVTLYTNVMGYETYLLNTFAGYPLWICSFSSTPFDADWTFWQYDHHGKVSGISGDVDLNTFSGSRSDWKQFTAESSFSNSGQSPDQLSEP